MSVRLQSDFMFGFSMTERKSETNSAATSTKFFKICRLFGRLCRVGVETYSMTAEHAQTALQPRRCSKYSSTDSIVEFKRKRCSRSDISMEVPMSDECLPRHPTPVISILDDRSGKRIFLPMLYASRIAFSLI